MAAMDGSTYSENSSSRKVALLQAYFVTIATILGTGILGLPVTLTNSGLYPFIVSFLLDAVLQSILIQFFVELLQRAYAVQLESIKDEAMPLNSMVEEEVDIDGDGGDGETKKVTLPAFQGHITQPPNLHLLGKLFLSVGVCHMFDALIILQFIALLICYALAGSEAYAQLIGISHVYVIPVFVWVLSFAIVFALQFLQPIISILTFLKGSVLFLTTMVIFGVGAAMGHSSQNDFSYITAPLLMGSVAIGGTINTMPFTFEKMKFEKLEIEKYRLAVQLGLWTCVFLNILWCWSVLDIVPQTVAQACDWVTWGPHVFVNLTMMKANEGMCFGELSLESAKMHGEISTLPLTKILTKDYPGFSWVAILVEVFIMVSITVSFLTIGGALHHTLTGIVQSLIIKKGLKELIQPSSTSSASYCSRLRVVSVLTSLLAFIVIFAVSMANPQGFVDILEKFASLTLNLQAGAFVFLMLMASKRAKIASVPAPLPVWFWFLAWTLPIFFLSAVVLDVYSTIKDWQHPMTLIPVNITYRDSLANWSTTSRVAGSGNLFT